MLKNKTQHFSTEKKLRSPLHDVINREIQLSDPMNFLNELKNKLQKNDVNKSIGYCDLQKKRNTSNSQENNRSLNKRIMTQPDNLKKSKNPISQTPIHQSGLNKFFSSKKISQETELQLSCQLSSLKKKQLEHENLALKEKISNLEQQIIKQDSEMEDYKQIIDQLYTGPDSTSYIEKIKYIASNSNDPEDQYMLLDIENKELKQKINEITDQVQFLQQEIKTYKLKLINQQIESQKLIKINTDLYAENNKQLTQIEELSQMFDSVVVKYQLQISNLEKQLNAQSPSRNDDNYHIKFQLQFTDRENDNQNYDDIFQQIITTRNNDEKSNKQTLKYQQRIQQLQNLLNTEKKSSICLLMYINFLKQKRQEISILYK